MKIYTVKEGDTLRSVAEANGMAPMRLAEDNGLELRARLISGEELFIAEPTRTAYARRGDDVGGIARRYGARSEDILAYNPELAGRNELYEGQSLAIKYGGSRWGMGIGNGYYYGGCSRERLQSAMPYLSFITVCAAVYDGERLSLIFDDGDVVEPAKANGKLPILRIYVKKLPDEGKYGELISSTLILARSHGYSGVTLGGLGVGQTDECKSLIMEMRRAFIECELRLFVEEELGDSRGLSEYADGAVLFYDKVGLERVPSFEEGEGVLMKEYAESHESMRSFIDLSPYAYSAGKYIPKEEMLGKLRRLSPEITRIADGDVLVATVGTGRRERAYIYEGLKNLEKRLKSISENGYYGMSFDIARCPTRELLMFRIMFSAPIGI